jgi:hypothetical protein
VITSYNGWPASTDKTAIGIVPLNVTLDGVTYSFPGGCKGGDVYTIFTHFLPRYHRLVEPLGLGHDDEWGYAYRQNRNADNLSCHASGTAVDVNASEHPNGQRRTLTSEQVRDLEDVLHFYEGVLKWGGDFHGTADEMHYEINRDSAEVHRIALKIQTPPKEDIMASKEELQQMIDTAVAKIHAEHVLILRGDDHGHVGLAQVNAKLDALLAKADQ